MELCRIREGEGLPGTMCWQIPRIDTAGGIIKGYRDVLVGLGIFRPSRLHGLGLLGIFRPSAEENVLKPESGLCPSGGTGARSQFAGQVVPYGRHWLYWIKKCQKPNIKQFFKAAKSTD